MPRCVENFGKVWTIIYADYAWGQSTDPRKRVVKQGPFARCHELLIF
jgi:hypothetical protein